MAMYRPTVYIQKDQSSQCPSCNEINFFTRDILTNELPIVLKCSKCGKQHRTSIIIKCKAVKGVSQNTGEWIVVDKPIQEETKKSLRQQLDETIRYISNISTELSKKIIDADLLLKEYKQMLINTISPRWERLNYVYDIKKDELLKFTEFPFCVIRMSSNEEFIGNNAFLVLMPDFIYIKIGIEIGNAVKGYNVFIVNKYTKLSWTIPLGIVGIGDEINENNYKILSVRAIGRKLIGEDVSTVKDEAWVEKDVDYSDNNISLIIKSFFGYYKWCLLNNINPYEDPKYKVVTDFRGEVNIMLTDEQRLLAEFFFKNYRINVSGDVDICIANIERIIKILKPSKLVISDNTEFNIGCARINRRSMFDGFINPDNDYSVIIIDTIDDPMDENELEYLCENYHGPIINITNDLVLDTYTDNINAFNMYSLCQKSYQFGSQKFNCIANAILEL